MKARFQADNDLRNSIRTGVVRREPSIDFQSANQAQLHGVPDDEVLRLAARHERIVVSHDENSMPRCFREFLSTGGQSPGVLIVPQDVSTGAAIESILLLWAASEGSKHAAGALP